MENQTEKNLLNIDTNFIYFLLVTLLAIIVMVESMIIFRRNSSIAGSQDLAVKETVEEQKPVISNAVSSGTLSFIKFNETTIRLVFNSPEVPIGGVDAVINFDPKKIKISKVIPNKDLFNQAAVNSVQEKDGRIKITAYFPKKELTGIQIVADLEYLLIGDSANLSLEFKGPSLAGDSNLISQLDQQDVLGKVIPLTLSTK